MKSWPEPIVLKFPDAKALGMLIKDILKLSENAKPQIVEVGTWTGSSLLVIIEAIRPYGGDVFAIDHWKGNPGTKLDQCAKENDIYAIFRERMIDNGVWDMIQPLVMDSVSAASKFKDNTLDMVFIDADHRYDCVKQDILAWWPKVREGGLLCGHDCEGFYSHFPENFRLQIDESANTDTIDLHPPPRPFSVHPGVIKALYDCFNDQYQIMPGSSIWYKEKSCQ